MANHLLLLSVFIVCVTCAAIPDYQPSLAELGLTQRNVNLRSGGFLNIVEKGPASGEPVIFVHGWPDSWKSWITTIPFLSTTQNKRYVFVDLRGFGNSTRSFDNFVSFEQDVVEMMDALNIQKADLVGHSMGSLIVRDIAIDFPTRVNRLILIGSGPTAAEVGQAIEDFAQIFEMTTIDAEFVDAFQKSTFYNLTAAPAWFVDSVVYQSTVASLEAWKRGLTYIIADNRGNATISRVRASTLVITGQFDTLFAPEYQAQLVELIQGSKQSVVLDAGHSVQWDKPEAVADLINDFLAPSCVKAATFVQTRAGSWTSKVNGQDVQYSQWNVVLQVGAEQLYSTQLSINGVVTNIWNVDKAGTGLYTVPKYVYQNGVLPANSNSFSFGYIKVGNQPAVIKIVNDACHPPVDCAPSVVPTKQASWSSNGALHQQYVLNVNNNTPRTLANVNVRIAVATGSSLSNTNNLVLVSQNNNEFVYTCPTYNLAPGGSSSSCGYTINTLQGNTLNSYASVSLAQPICI